MSDMLDNLRFYQKAKELFDLCWVDSELLLKDTRGKEIAAQLVRCSGSIPANIEEGTGRGFGKEYPHFLRIARGSAKETKGWYIRSKHLLPAETIRTRIQMLNEITGALTKTIQTFENKKQK